MIKVEKGMPLDVRTKKTGTNKNGQKWVMFKATAEGTRDTLSVFATNAEDAEYFTTAKVGNIVSVNKRDRRREDGSWETLVSVNAFIDGRNERAVRDRDAYRSFAESVERDKPIEEDFMDMTKDAQTGDFDLPFN